MKKILFIEHRAALWRPYREMLEMWGHSIEMVSTAEEAHARLQADQSAYGGVITAKQGFGVLKLLKGETGPLSQLPVIVYSMDDSLRYATQDAGGIFMSKCGPLDLFKRALDALTEEA